MYKDINCILLAGGKSLRMGEEKALLKIGNKTMLEYTLDKVAPLFNKVILSTNSPEKFTQFGLPSFIDLIIGGGPLSGIYTGLINSETERNFVISCDMPLISQAAIKFIVDYDLKSEVVVAKADGYIQQLCGVYNKSILDKARTILESPIEEISNGSSTKKRCKVLELLDNVESKVFDFASEFPGDSENLFFNMNRKEEYAYILSRLEK